MPAPYRVNAEVVKLKVERERELLGIPGVIGVGLGRDKNQDVIVIMSERNDKKLHTAVEKVITGTVKYIIRTTSPFRAGTAD